MAARGTIERARTRKGSHQSPAIQPFKLQLGRKYLSVPVDWDIKLVRIRAGVEKDVSRFVERLDWSDTTDGSAGGMSGSLTGRRPAPLDPSSLPLEQGDRIAVRYRDSFSRGPWKEEVRLQVDSPQSEPTTGVVNYTLDSPFVAFENVERMFIYRKDKHHKNGWRMDTIIRHACASCGAPYGRIARGMVEFPRTFKGDAFGDDRKHTPRSPLLAFVMKCIAHEQKETGRKLIVAITNGALEVIERGAGSEAYVLDPSAQEFQVQTNANPRPPTMIRAYGRIGKGRGAKHKTVVVSSARAMDKFGTIIREEHFGQVKSEADLRDQAKRLLANGSKESTGLRVVRTATATVSGVPGLRPFDAVVLASPKDARGVPEYQGHFSSKEFGDDDGLCFITSRSHSIEGGLWTTQLELGERDPWLKYRAALAEHKVGFRKRKAKSPAPKKDSKKATETRKKASSKSSRKR